MHRCLSLLLIASLLAHATFGCCLHHAHAIEQNDSDVPHVHATLSSLGHSHEHAADRQIKPGSISPKLLKNLSDGWDSVPLHGHQPCADAKCSFARTELESPSVAFDAAEVLVVSVLPELSHVPSIAYARQPIFSKSSVVSLTLRRHLVLAVFVI